MDDDVSRGTPLAPVSARGVFSPSQLLLAERYAQLLATEGVVRGLIGPREAGRLWDRHLLNCAVLGEWVPEGATVCDIGSGAGLPGVALAIARPDVQITLVEPLLRRTTFLDEVVADLGLSGVEVVRGRAEALQGARVFDVVTSRAVARLDKLLDWSMPLVAPTGALVAMKGSAIADEVAEVAPVLAARGCAPAEIGRLGASLLDTPTTAVRVRWADPSAVSWPRAAPSPGAGRRGSKARGSRAGGGRRTSDRKKGA